MRVPMPPQRMTTFMGLRALAKASTYLPSSSQFPSLFDREDFFRRLNPIIMVIERQVRIVIRVATPLVLPALLEGFQFLGRNAGLGRPLIVVELSIGNEDHTFAAANHAQAIIHVVVIQGESFVEPTQLMEEIGSGH